MLNIKYYPFMRGKQYEILSLRDFYIRVRPAHQGGLVNPIIEPVKPLDNKQFKDLFSALNNNDYLYIVYNPEVGNYSGNTFSPDEYIDFFKDWGGKVRFLFNYSTETANHLDEFKNISPKKRIFYIHEITSNIEDDVINCLDPEDYVMANGSILWQLKMHGLQDEKVIAIQDPFRKENKNADYINTNEYLFIDQKMFAKASFAGYSDFLTIGDNYSESGFTPRSVAIHWSYTYENNISSIYLNSFASESNSMSTSDIGGKFIEAAKKINDFVERENIYRTQGFNDLKGKFEEDKYPGLGSIKRYSMLNHLEFSVRGIENENL